MAFFGLNPDDRCPVCGDKFSDHSNYQPVWSDHYDNVVCYHCNAEFLRKTEFHSDECGFA